MSCPVCFDVCILGITCPKCKQKACESCYKHQSEITYMETCLSCDYIFPLHEAEQLSVLWRSKGYKKEKYKRIAKLEVLKFREDLTPFAMFKKHCKDYEDYMASQQLEVENFVVVCNEEKEPVILENYKFDKYESLVASYLICEMQQFYNATVREKYWLARHWFNAIKPSVQLHKFIESLKPDLVAICNQ